MLSEDHMKQWTAGRTAVTVIALGVLTVGMSACGSTMAGGSSSSASAPSSASVPSPTSTVPTEAVIGLTVDEATAWAANHNYTVRVVEIDGQPQPATMDYRTDRINLVVKNGVVTSAKMG